MNVDSPRSVTIYSLNLSLNLKCNHRFIAIIKKFIFKNQLALGESETVQRHVPSILLDSCRPAYRTELKVPMLLNLFISRICDRGNQSSNF